MSTLQLLKVYCQREAEPSDPDHRPRSLSLSQAVIQNSYSNGGSPAGDATGGETRFAYYPASKAATAVVSEGSVSLQTGTGSGSGSGSDPTLAQAGGGFGPKYC